MTFPTRFARHTLLCALGFLSSVFSVVGLAFPAPQQLDKPDWCKPLPRSEYKSLERVKVSDPWFEVYRVAPNTFGIYEPHQSEETIGYLILGSQKAILLDTGMGINDVKKVVMELVKNGGAKDGGVNPPLQMIVPNSHTHDDHVGG